MPTQAAITVDSESPAFDTADAAASALSAKFRERKHAEMAAMIYLGQDGKFRYSTTVDGRDDNFKLRAVVPKDSSLAGIVHSHPGSDDLNLLFSPDDLSVSDKLKIPSYIHFLREDTMRRYTPGVTKTDSTYVPRSAYPVRTTRGDDMVTAPPEPTTDSASQLAIAQALRRQQPEKTTP